MLGLDLTNKSIITVVIGNLAWPGPAGSADAQGERHCLAFTQISVLRPVPSVSSYRVSLPKPASRAKVLKG